MPRDLFAALGTQAVASTGQLALTLYLVASLGVEGFGAVALVLLIAAYGAGLAQALIAQPLLSIHALEPAGQVRRTRDASLWLGLGLSLLLGTGAAGLGVLMRGSSSGWSLALSGEGVRWLLPLLVATRSLVPVVRARAFACGRLGATVAVDALGSWGALLLLLFGAPAAGLTQGEGVTVDLALLGITASTAAACAVAVATVRPGGLALVDGVRTARRLWTSGCWLAGNQALSWLGTGSFHAATAALTGPLGVGALRTAQTVVGAGLTALQALDLALPVRAAAAARAHELAPWTRRTALRLALPLALGGAAVAWHSSMLVGLLLDAAAEPLAALESARALRALALLPAISAITLVLHVAFRSIERTTPLFMAYAATSGLGAALAWPLVARFGISGAAGGLVLQQALHALLLAGSWAWSQRRDSRPAGGAGVRALLESPVCLPTERPRSSSG